MNQAHWHLVINHLPIIFPLVGTFILATGLITKSETIKRTAYLIYIIGSLTAMAAMYTGEGAEDVIENLNGGTENFIKNHEEAAETFAALSYILGGISVLGIWASLKRKKISNVLSIGILVFAFLVLLFAQQTGTSGGKIRHPEIRNTSDVIPDTDSR